MERLEQIIDLLKGLSDEDIEKLKVSLKADAENVSDKEELVNENNVEEDNSEEIVESEENAETDEEKQEKVEDEKVVDESEETESEELENLNTEQLDPPQEEKSEEIPTMQKSGQVEDNDIVVPPQAEIEEDLIEKEKIIEAQKAKIEALETENATLKSKVEGAFGYSSKASMPAKTNRLYDDCSDVHIHR